jgi:hypothetical protein
MGCLWSQISPKSPSSEPREGATSFQHDITFEDATAISSSLPLHVGDDESTSPAFPIRASSRKSRIVSVRGSMEAGDMSLSYCSNNSMFRASFSSRLSRHPSTEQSSLPNHLPARRPSSDASAPANERSIMESVDTVFTTPAGLVSQTPSPIIPTEPADSDSHSHARIVQHHDVHDLVWAGRFREAENIVREMLADESVPLQPYALIALADAEFWRVMITADTHSVSDNSSPRLTLPYLTSLLFHLPPFFVSSECTIDFGVFIILFQQFLLFVFYYYCFPKLGLIRHPCVGHCNHCYSAHWQFLLTKKVAIFKRIFPFVRSLICQVEKTAETVNGLIARVEAVTPVATLFQSLTPEQSTKRDECEGVIGHMLLLRGIMEAFQANYMKAALTLRYDSFSFIYSPLFMFFLCFCCFIYLFTNKALAICRQSLKRFEGISPTSASEIGRSMRIFGITTFSIFLGLAPPAVQVLFDSTEPIPYFQQKKIFHG